MPSPKIVIPSHKRADLVKAKDLVHDPIICVAESQLEEYKRFNPECEIVTHPDSVVGLIPKRNWMAKHFGDLFMLDDDVYCCRRIFIEAGESQPIHDKDKVTQIIFDLHDMAEMLGLHLYGFTNKTSPMMFDDTNWLRLDAAITGCSYGVIANENTVWNKWIEDVRRNPIPVPEYTFDVHTKRGKMRGKTKEQFFVEEFKALKPREEGLFDSFFSEQDREEAKANLVKRTFPNDEYFD